jgi:multimeric flavodoxin WrbA
MIKNILLINGSPRGGKSNTLQLSNSFLAGFLDVNKNINVETITLKDQNIQTCKGCFNCWNNEQGKCALKDDMPGLLEKFLAADLVIWSFPLYHFGMPSIVKAFHERTLPVMLPFIERYADGSCTHPLRDQRYHEKKHLIISTCGFCSAKNNYEALTRHLDRLHGSNYEKIYCVEGELLRVPQLANITQPYLEAIKQAGIEYARSGSISQETHAILDTPMVEEEAFIEMANASWGIEAKKTTTQNTNNLKAYNFMRQMRASFNSEASKGIEAILQINYTDLNESYQFIIKDQACELAAGTEHSPKTIIDTDFDTWMKISEGSLDGPQAMMQKKMRVSGDFNFMMVMNDIFGGRRTNNKQSIKAAENTNKKSKMILFLLPWIILWVILPFNTLNAAMAALAASCLIGAAGELKWDLTIYERINPIILTAVLTLVIFDLASLQILIAVSYLLFGLIWLASFFVNIPLTAWYSRYMMGDKALANSLFIETNRILTVLWGLLYVLTTIWTYYLWYTPLFLYSGLINQIAPILMGIFTAWFSKWYPARVARG